MQESCRNMILMNPESSEDICPVVRRQPVIMAGIYISKQIKKANNNLMVFIVIISRELLEWFAFLMISPPPTHLMTFVFDDHAGMHPFHRCLDIGVRPSKAGIN